MGRNSDISSPHLVEDTTPSEESGAPLFASLREESPYWRICSNLAAYVSALPKVPADRTDASMFRSSRLPRKSRGRSLLASGLLHIGVIACLVTLPSLPNPLAQHSERLVPSDHKIIWYNQAGLLPAISPADSARASKGPKKVTPAVSRKRMAFAPVQVIISKPPKPDNARQTIIQPDAPELKILSHVPVPNIVRWTGAVAPPRPAVAEEKRELARISVPHLPAPVVSAIPTEPLKPMEPIKPPDLTRKLSEVAIAVVPSVAVPKLPVPQAPPLTSAVSTKKAADIPAPPTLPSGPASTINADALRNLIVVGTAPAPPDEKMIVPPGNRAGEFAMSPQGSKDEKDSGEPGKGGSSGDGGMPGLGGGNAAEIHMPNLSISGGKPGGPPGGGSPGGAAGGGPSLPQHSERTPAVSGEDLSKLIAKATRPSLLPEMSRGRRVEPPFFGGKHVYTLSINMPNLTSGSGSWVLLFAELDDAPRSQDESEELSSPVAMRKIDPQYTPSAVRDRIEGTVMLAAHILRDGRVSNVHVMRGVDPRLDSSAMEALTEWEFVPAKRKGVPVDLEVLVQIPFRLPPPRTF